MMLGNYPQLIHNMLKDLTMVGGHLSFLKTLILNRNSGFSTGLGVPSNNNRSKF